jgi:hypothetical protein
VSRLEEYVKSGKPKSLVEYAGVKGQKSLSEYAGVSTPDVSTASLSTAFKGPGDAGPEPSLSTGNRLGMAALGAGEGAQNTVKRLLNTLAASASPLGQATPKPFEESNKAGLLAEMLRPSNTALENVGAGAIGLAPYMVPIAGQGLFAADVATQPEAIPEMGKDVVRSLSDILRVGQPLPPPDVVERVRQRPVETFANAVLPIGLIAGASGKLGSKFKGKTPSVKKMSAMDAKYRAAAGPARGMTPEEYAKAVYDQTGGQSRGLTPEEYAKAVYQQQAGPGRGMTKEEYTKATADMTNKRPLGLPAPDNTGVMVKTPPKGEVVASALPQMKLFRIQDKIKNGKPLTPLEQALWNHYQMKLGSKSKSPISPVEEPAPIETGKQAKIRVGELPGEDIARAETDGTITVDKDKFFGHSPKDQADIIAHEQAHFLEEKISPEYKARLFDNPTVMKYRGRNINEKLANMIQDGTVPPEVLADYPDLAAKYGKPEVAPAPVETGAATYINADVLERVKKYQPKSTSLDDAPTLGELMTGEGIRRYDIDPDVKVIYDENMTHPRAMFKAGPKDANVAPKYIVLGKNSDAATIIHEAVHTARLKKGRSMEPSLAEPSAERATPVAPKPGTNVPEKGIIEPPTPPAETAKVPEPPLGERAESQLAVRAEADAIEAKLTKDFGELPEYKTMNMADQAKRAQETLDADYEKAKRMAMGQEPPPTGIREASMYEAVKIRAIKEGDVETLRQLATESTVPTKLSEYGQAIKAADSELMNDPVRVMRDVAKTRAERGKLTGKKYAVEQIASLRKQLEEAKTALSERIAGKVEANGKKSYGSKNKIVTQESYQQALKDIRGYATQMSSGVDPKALAAISKIGAYHFEAGTRAFAEWSARVVADAGEWVKPYLPELHKEISNDRRQQIGLKAQKTRLANETKKFGQKLEDLDLTKEERRVIKLDPEAIRLKQKRDQAKRNYQAAMDASGSVTKEEAAEIVRLSDDYMAKRGAWEAKLKENESDLKKYLKTKPRERFEYGASQVVYEHYIDHLKGGDAPIKTMLKNRAGEFGTTWKTNAPRAVGEAGLDAAKVVADNSVSLVSTLDNSFIGSQGAYTFLTHPTKWFNGAVNSFADWGKTIGGKNTKDALMADVYSRPRYMNGEYQKAGLIATSEEPFPSSFVGRIPALGRVFRASEQAFTGSALRMRLGVYDLLADRAIKNGVKWGDNDIVSFGEVINSLTARGGAKWTNNPLIRLAMWAPKMLQGQIDVLTVHRLGSGLESNRARWEASKNLLKITAEVASFMALCNYLKPGSAPTDPKSTAFGKVKIGDTYYQYAPRAIGLVVLASRLITGKTTNLAGKTTKLEPGFGKRTRLEVVSDFVTGKFNPPAGVLRDALRGEFFDRSKFTLGGAIYRSHTPIFLQQSIALKDNASADRVAAALLDGLGVSSTTPFEYKPKQGSQNAPYAPTADHAPTAPRP